MFFTSKCHIFNTILYSALLMIIAGFGYDMIVGEAPCSICLMQRGILGLLMIAALARSIRGLKIIATLGLVLTLRHMYVVAFPEQVKGCLPFDMVMYMPWKEKLYALGDWIQHLGKSCTQSVDTVTYVLIPVLLVYYVLILYMVSRNK